MSVLYITEKSSQVQALRDALKANGMYGDIASLSGHIMGMYNFKEYDKEFDEKSWLELVTSGKVPYFPKEIKKKVKPKTSYKTKDGKKGIKDYPKIFADAKAKIDKADKIILATDPDNEGVTLGMEVIEKCNAIHKVIGMVNMAKLDLPSLIKEVKVTNKLTFQTMYKAGNLRGEYDQLLGFNASMFSTVYLGKGKVLNVGGVKLPLIRMVVDRDLAFENHKEIPYWTVTGKVKKGNDIFDVTFYTEDTEKNQFDKEDQAKELVKNLSSKGIIKAFEEKIKKTSPPKPYGLPEIQKDAGRRFKLTPKQVLNKAQNNYELKIESYPRVECNYYSTGEFENAKDVITCLSNIKSLQYIINEIDTNDLLMRKNIFDDSKITGAHTAIAPSSTATLDIISKLDTQCLGIFEMISIRYLIQFLPDYEYLSINGNGEASAGVYFKFNQNVPQKRGWKIIENVDMDTQRVIPSMSEGEQVEILTNSITINKGTTKPKPRFKEDELPTVMGKIHLLYDDPKIKEELGEKGIGTSATRGDIIEDCKKSRKGDEPYFVNVKGSIISTQKARDLIATLPEEYTSPILRAKMEGKLNEIVQGTLGEDEFKEDVKKLVIDFYNTVKSMGSLPKPKVKLEAKPIDYKCPICNEGLVEDDRVYKCSTQKFSQGKLNGCKFVLFKTNKILERTIDHNELNIFLQGGTLKSDRATIKIALDDKFFMDVTWNQSAPRSNSDRLYENPRAFNKNGKVVFKDFRGKALTKSQAEKLLDGKSVTVSRVAKAGNKYSVKLTLANDKGKLDTEMVNTRSKGAGGKPKYSKAIFKG
jgi:DNA topoisomerase-3